MRSAGVPREERQVERAVLRIQANQQEPHGATADFDLVRLVNAVETGRERGSPQGPIHGFAAWQDGFPFAALILRSHQFPGRFCSTVLNRLRASPGPGPAHSESAAAPLV